MLCSGFLSPFFSYKFGVQGRAEVPGQNDHAQEISVYSISERISSKLSECREVVWWRR